MRNQLAPVGAILLLLSSAPLVAAEPPFHAPSTHRAQESVRLLHRAARALYGSTKGRSRISDLWLFPTDAPNTVFAQYQLSAKERGGATEHLVVLTLQGDRIIRMRDLTDTVAVIAHGEAASHSQTEESYR
jgi:hypothetical protein